MKIIGKIEQKNEYRNEHKNKHEKENKKFNFNKVFKYFSFFILGLILGISLMFFFFNNLSLVKENINQNNNTENKKNKGNIDKENVNEKEKVTKKILNTSCLCDEKEKQKYNFVEKMNSLKNRIGILDGKNLINYIDKEEKIKGIAKFKLKKKIEQTKKIFNNGINEICNKYKGTKDFIENGFPYTLNNLIIDYTTITIVENKKTYNKFIYNYIEKNCKKWDKKNKDHLYKHIIKKDNFDLYLKNKGTIEYINSYSELIIDSYKGIDKVFFKKMLFNLKDEVYNPFKYIYSLKYKWKNLLIDGKDFTKLGLYDSTNKEIIKQIDTLLSTQDLTTKELKDIVLNHYLKDTTYSKNLKGLKELIEKDTIKYLKIKGLKELATNKNLHNNSMEVSNTFYKIAEKNNGIEDNILELILKKYYYNYLKDKENNILEKKDIDNNYYGYTEYFSKDVLILEKLINILYITNNNINLGSSIF